MDCIGFYVGPMGGTLVYDKSGLSPGRAELENEGQRDRKKPQGDRPLLSDGNERYTRTR